MDQYFKICDPLPLVIHPTVQSALRHGSPVVALESTIIAHGMPFPENFQTAQILESTVLRHGATPATIAVLGGIPHIGLNTAQLHIISKSKEKIIHKLALRDLPLAYAEQRHGATTVSATMHLAHRAGIHVFATGGIGGVHRHVEDTWDISADIPALARFPVLVVCAGAKAILDIPKTLEALETASVPVFVLGEHDFPAFYTRTSGEKAPATVSGVKEAARAFKEAASSLQSGALLAVPLPKEAEPDVGGVQKAVEVALKEVRVKQQRGEVRPAQVTPFLLKRVAELTGGASLKANMSLAKHNAAVAAQTAVELSKLLRRALTFPIHGGDRVMMNGSTDTIIDNDFNRSKEACVAVIGAAVLDVLAMPVYGQPRVRSTLKGSVAMRPGGVALNIAMAASRFSRAHVRLLSAVGDDAQGHALSSLLHSSPKDTQQDKNGHKLPHTSSLDVSTPIAYGRRGAVVSIAHDGDGEIITGVADTDALFGVEQAPLHVLWGSKLTAAVFGVKVVILDANLCVNDLSHVIHVARKANADIWLEPTSVAKCTRLLEADVFINARYISPNVLEAVAMAKVLRQQKESSIFPSNGRIEESNDYTKDEDAMLEDAAFTLLSTLGTRVEKQTLFITRGEKGVSRFQICPRDGMVRTDFRACNMRQVVSTTGAGDCFAGCCAAFIALGANEDDAVKMGIVAAAASCMSEECVPDQNVFRRLLASYNNTDKSMAKL